MKCKWTIRDGYGNSYWGYTSCTKRYVYLSRVSSVEEIKPFYEGRLCPICNNTIECDFSLINEPKRFWDAKAEREDKG